MTAMTALTASWARWDLAPEWFGAFAAGTAFGYIALARFDRPERRLEWWSGAIGGAVVGIALAHAFVAIDGEASRYAIPLTYGISLLAGGNPGACERDSAFVRLGAMGHGTLVVGRVHRARRLRLHRPGAG